MDSGRGKIKLKVSAVTTGQAYPKQVHAALALTAGGQSTKARATHGRLLPYSQSDKRPGQVKACQFSLFCEYKVNDVPPTHPTRRQSKG